MISQKAGYWTLRAGCNKSQHSREEYFTGVKVLSCFLVSPNETAIGEGEGEGEGRREKGTPVVPRQKGK